MVAQRLLPQFLDHSAQSHPDDPAVVEPNIGTITYGELARLSDRLRDRLYQLGVRPGDRVGMYLRKSIDAVATIFGILKVGAAYVPVDPYAPVARNAYIFANCSVRAVVAEWRFADRLRAEMEPAGEKPTLLLLDGVGGGRPLQQALEQEEANAPGLPAETFIGAVDDLAYILYTSGSTGKPKGVMLSHRNAISFIDWASEVFTPTRHDRFSAHAPFHFDLSILDIFLAIKHGATLILIGDDVGRDPARLSALIAQERLSIWYSAPSILSLLAQYGHLERHDYTALRLVLFAGEVFPVKHLRALQSLLPGPRYFNLYGPTETNVCTYYEVPTPIPEARTAPFPIGKACTHCRTKVVDEQGHEVPRGQEGELCVNGPGVMQGYWNLPELTARAFLEEPPGQRWYKTGDIVVEGDEGNYHFLGRRDRMVKRRGYRVELGEIEAALYRHPAIREAAVIALPGHEGEVQIKAFLSCHGGQRPSLVELKQFCAEQLPLYMVPDLFSSWDTLPKTSTDKIDYQRLKEME